LRILGSALPAQRVIGVQAPWLSVLRMFKTAYNQAFYAYIQGCRFV
jgi:hypothetical protein